MKQFLLAFLCIFVVFSSASSQESLPDISVAGWERQTGKTAADFIKLLEQPRSHNHPLVVSWIDELLERNDPAIDHQLVQLLAQEHWIPSLNQDYEYTSRHIALSRWMETLTKREFADDEDATAMLKESPWDYFAVDNHGINILSNLIRQTSTNMVNNERDLRAAVGHTFARYLIALINSRHPLWSLADNLRVFTWTITILKTMKAQGFERRFADAFRAKKNENEFLWENFDDVDRLTEFLLTESTATLASRLLFVASLPRTHHPQRLNWILTAIEEETRNLQENVNAYNYDWSTVDSLGFLLSTHLSERTLSQPTNTTSNLSQEDINTALTAVDLLLNIIDSRPGNTYHNLYIFSPYTDYLPDVLTTLAKEIGFDNPRIYDTKVPSQLEVAAKEIGFDDPRIYDRVGKILERNHLPFPQVLQLLRLPEWREHPNAPSLLARVIRGVGGHRPSAFSDTRRLEELLEDPFWQNHFELKKRMGRQFPGFYRPVTFENILKYYNDESCPTVLTALAS